MLTPEFNVIARYFTWPSPGAVLGVGDDCALLALAQGQELAVSTDTLVAGVHFFPDTDAARLGHKALAVNLSDLAAMGARPRWFTLALTLPRIDHDWLGEFSAGLHALAQETGIELVGGDTTSGPLSMTLTVMGEVPAGQALRRDGARAGDDIWVSGSLGDAALGVRCLQGAIALPEPQRRIAIDRIERPSARVSLGLRLRGLAHGAIDISDGLTADLGHVCECSRLAARIEWNAVPLGAALNSLADETMRRQCALAGGDDYELCFTAPPAARNILASLSSELNLALSRIGLMSEGEGVTIVDAAGSSIVLASPGFDHFAPA